jgi:hypothetical protein
MKRFVIKLLRVLNSTDPKVDTVQNGENFTDVDGNLYYKRHDTGAIILVAKVNNSVSFAQVTNKPTNLTGYGITLAPSDIPTIDKSKVTFGTGNFLSTYGITLSSGDIPTIDKAQVTFGTGNALVDFGITLSGSDIPSLNWSTITSGKPTTLAGYGIVDAAPLVHSQAFSTITGRPTTLAGYGITDAAPLNAPNFTGLPSIVGTRTFGSLVDADILTKGEVVTYVNTALSFGLKVLPHVRVATTGPITLSGLQTIDGVSLNVNDPVLVKDQASGIFNGVFLAQAGSWTRDASMAATTTASINTYIFVNEGSTLGSSAWVVSGSVAPVVGTDPISFFEFSSSTIYAAGAGLGKTGNTFYVADVIAGGTATKVTFNTKGQITGTGSLLASDIPVLDWSKITTGKPTTLGGYGITDAQAYNVNLASLAGLTLSSNKILVTSGTNVALTAITSFVRDTIFPTATAKDLRALLKVPNSRVITQDITSTVPSTLFSEPNVLRVIDASTDDGAMFVFTNPPNIVSAGIYGAITSAAWYYANYLRLVLDNTSVGFDNGFSITVVNGLKSELSKNIRVQWGTDANSTGSNIFHSDKLYSNIISSHDFLIIRPGEAYTLTNNGTDGFIVTKVGTTERVSTNIRNRNANLLNNTDDSYTTTLRTVDDGFGSLVYDFGNKSTNILKPITEFVADGGNEIEFQGVTQFGQSPYTACPWGLTSYFSPITSETFANSSLIVIKNFEVVFSRENTDEIFSVPQQTQIPFNAHVPSYFYVQKSRKTGEVTYGVSYTKPKYVSYDRENMSILQTRFSNLANNSPIDAGNKNLRYGINGAKSWTTMHCSMRNFSMEVVEAYNEVSGNTREVFKFVDEIYRGGVYNGVIWQEFFLLADYDATSPSNFSKFNDDGVFDKSWEFNSAYSSGLSYWRVADATKSNLSVTTAPLAFADTPAVYAPCLSLWLNFNTDDFLVPVTITGSSISGSAGLILASDSVNNIIFGIKRQSSSTYYFYVTIGGVLNYQSANQTVTNSKIHIMLKTDNNAPPNLTTFFYDVYINGAVIPEVYQTIFTNAYFFRFDTFFKVDSTNFLMHIEIDDIRVIRPHGSDFVLDNEVITDLFNEPEFNVYNYNECRWYGIDPEFDRVYFGYSRPSLFYPPSSYGSQIVPTDRHNTYYDFIYAHYHNVPQTTFLFKDCTLNNDGGVSIPSNDTNALSVYTNFGTPVEAKVYYKFQNSSNWFPAALNHSYEDSNGSLLRNGGIHCKMDTSWIGEKTKILWTDLVNYYFRNGQVSNLMEFVPNSYDKVDFKVEIKRVF